MYDNIKLACLAAAHACIAMYSKLKMNCEEIISQISLVALTEGKHHS